MSFSVKPGDTLYFMGIGGTGMAAVAGLCQRAGFKVLGSDKGVYPPTSDMLKKLKIAVKTPYAEKNVKAAKPDLVVVANALSRGHQEVEYVLNNEIPFTSFPKLLEEVFLQERSPVVVAGTHGKTTTTSLVAYLLKEIGVDPSYLIGGLPREFKHSFHLGEGKLFVIEGDEYDTAFFDKEPKFLHYRPEFLIINNIEFDHADIYRTVEDIEEQFHKLVPLVKQPKNIIVNADDPGILKLLRTLKIMDQVTLVSTSGSNDEADVVVKDLKVDPDDAEQLWRAKFACKGFGNVPVATKTMTGKHNMANIAQTLGLFCALRRAGLVSKSIKPAQVGEVISEFQGVKRRLDHLGTVKGGIDVYEDFAHHPTAIRSVIEGFRLAHPGRRLVVAFEPANATGRRNVLTNDFVRSLSLADKVFIGSCPVDQRIPEAERMDTNKMSQSMGKKAQAFDTNDKLLKGLVKEVEAGDAVIFMSSNSFSGVQYKATKDIRARFR